MGWSAARWRAYYDRERAALGAEGLGRLLDAGEALAEVGTPCVFPHARLAVCGAQVAAAALAVVRSGRERVLVLGVLHGAREADAALVSAARRGDASARDALRRVHGHGVPGDAGRWRDEFSLDGFAALLPLAARRCGRPAPTVIARFPFLVAGDPASLPGIDELCRLVADGCAVVATADPVHHGAGYGTPRDAQRHGDAAAALARGAITAQLDALAAADHRAFDARCTLDSSDFRDVGAVLAELAPGRGSIRDLVLVDYAAVLDAAAPTWVAAALIAWAVR